MPKAKIYGAGSIGNHLAQACRRMGWDVAIVDPDKEALRRTKEEIYPSRYGSWDQSIALYELSKEPKGGFDVIFLGTPPHVRMDLACRVLDEHPKIIQLEKPLCAPDMSGVEAFSQKLFASDSLSVVGYDHAVSKAVKNAEAILRSGKIGAVRALDVEFRENWKGIFSAHPWLSGPKDTYLGFWKRGGGAACEHSHALNLWQHFCRILGFGPVQEVSALMDMVYDFEAEYDCQAFFHLTAENGFVGRVTQDVITDPVKKQLHIQGENGFLEILFNGWNGGDLIRTGIAGQAVEEIRIEKKRPDDFYEEVLHISDLLSGRINIKDSSISFERGLDTMRVVAAAHKSRLEKKTVAITNRRPQI